MASKHPGTRKTKTSKGAPEVVAAEVVDEDADDAKDGDDEIGEPEALDGDEVGPVGDDDLQRIAAMAPIADDDDGGNDDDKPALITTKERSLGARDPMAVYIQEIKRYPLLTREEEHRLAVDFVKNGDLIAARKLVTSNLRLVVKIAHEYRRAHRNLLDLIQEGNVGLMQAVKKYDPFRGVKLSSYAAWWIRAYILKFILANWRLVKIGTTQAQRKLFFNLKKERDKLEAMGIDASSEALAAALDVPEREVVDMEKRLAGGDLSLDAPIGSDDDDGRTRMDTMEGGLTSPAAAVEGSEFRALLREKLAAFADTLNGRERTLFEERLMNEQPKTLQDIGAHYGISRERARQLEARLLARLKVYLRAELGDAVEIAMGPET
jgi:RNA polymerase sigma-32 factor